MTEPLTVGGVGVDAHRKGADLFLLLALSVLKQRPDVDWRFEWIGVDPQSHPFLRDDMAKARLEDRVSYYPVRSDIWAWMNTVDVFVLPSRDDPFPLVCLEAASMEIPVVCFRDAGGIPKLLRSYPELTVPYLDIVQMAAAVIQLAENRDRRKEIGKDLRREVLEHYSTPVQAPKLFHLMESLE